MSENFCDFFWFETLGKKKEKQNMKKETFELSSTIFSILLPTENFPFLATAHWWAPVQTWTQRFFRYIHARTVFRFFSPFQNFPIFRGDGEWRNEVGRRKSRSSQSLMVLFARSGPKERIRWATKNKIPSKRFPQNFHLFSMPLQSRVATQWKQTHSALALTAFKRVLF